MRDEPAVPVEAGVTLNQMMRSLLRLDWNDIKHIKHGSQVFDTITLIAITLCSFFLHYPPTCCMYPGLQSDSWFSCYSLFVLTMLNVCVLC